MDMPREDCVRDMTDMRNVPERHHTTLPGRFNGDLNMAQHTTPRARCRLTAFDELECTTPRYVAELVEGWKA